MERERESQRNLCYQHELMIYIYIHIYECNIKIVRFKNHLPSNGDSHFFLKRRLSPQLAKHIFGKKSDPLSQVYKWSCFSVHSHMTSQTCYRHIYFVTELTQVPCRFLLKNFYKVSLQEFAVMRSHMTRKSSFAQTDSITDVVNIFRLSSDRNWGEVHLLKCSYILECLILHTSNALQLSLITFFHVD